MLLFFVLSKGDLLLFNRTIPSDKPPPANLELWGVFFFLESTFPPPRCYLLLLELELIGPSGLAQTQQQQTK